VEVGLTIVHRICKKKCEDCQNFPAKDIHKLNLIRLKINNKCIFIDFENNRTYIGWDEFIKNNNLPEGFIFYPKSGVYDASEKLYQNITPASSKTEKILKSAECVSGIFNRASGVILLGANLLFPLGAPVVYTAATIITGASSFKVYRQIVSLRDMHKYENHVPLEKSLSKWAELMVSAIGVLATPLHAHKAITSQVNATFKATGKALAVFHKGACITQCALEIFRVTLDFINDDFKITPKYVLKLRLDVFIVMGLLMSSDHIKSILEVRIDLCSIQVIYIFK